jgi:5'-deoxynucleotidase YfbR-like HD superfamily hydrolase
MFANGNGAVAGLALETTNLAAIVPLLWEISNLKRIKAANLTGSFAEDLSYRAWEGIAGGVDTNRVAVKITSDAVVAASLGAIDAIVLRDAGLSEVEVLEVLQRGFDSVSASVDKNLREELSAVLIEDLTLGETPSFVEKLARQPRSGATKLNAPKLIFDAPENHAEHCITVAVFGVLLAPIFNADIATVFLTALAHHFHNADLPDSGFAGEEMLGAYLPKVFNNLREKCLLELPEHLRDTVRKTFALTENAESAESKAFHAADVLDRVLQMRHHAEAAAFTLEYAMNEMELVHAGAIQAFHYDILQEAKMI